MISSQTQGVRYGDTVSKNSATSSGATPWDLSQDLGTFDLSLGPWNFLRGSWDFSLGLFSKNLSAILSKKCNEKLQFSSKLALKCRLARERSKKKGNHLFWG